MQEAMELLLSDLSSGFFIKQVLTIVGLFLFGVLFIRITCVKMEQKWSYLLAFPVGLALWCLICFLILTLGIPFSFMSIAIVTAVGMLLLFFTNRGNIHEAIDTAKDREKKLGHWMIFLLVIGMVFVTACVTTSALASFSVSNDTMYYYLYYPEVLLQKGGYAASFDTFLSDVGPMAAIIGTLPSLFGFDQIYGIHQFFNVNFILIFAFAIHEKAKRHLSSRNAVFIAVIGTVVMISSTPYLVVSKWVLANAYAMYYSFILLYLAYKYNPLNNETNEKHHIPLSVFFVFIGAISMLRMEGCVVACFIIVCMSTLHYSNKELIYSVMLSALLFPCLYYFRYFVFLRVSPLYSFLTWQKAMLIIVAMLFLLVYLALFRGKRFLKIQNRLRTWFLLAMVLANVGLFLLLPKHYKVVMQAFYENIIGRQGWGYSVELLVICFAVIGLLQFFMKRYQLKYKDISYETFIFVGYLFVLFAVSYARGGGLRYGIGDSGNRVLLQVAPLAWYALISITISFMKELESCQR